MPGTFTDLKRFAVQSIKEEVKGRNQDQKFEAEKSRLASLAASTLGGSISIAVGSLLDGIKRYVMELPKPVNMTFNFNYDSVHKRFEVKLPAEHTDKFQALIGRAFAVPGDAFQIRLVANPDNTHMLFGIVENIAGKGIWTISKLPDSGLSTVELNQRAVPAKTVG